MTRLFTVRVVTRLVFAALLASAAVLIWKTCWGRGGLPVARPVLRLDRVEPYRPEYTYRIPMPTTWRRTGDDIEVPTVEPADEKTRKLLEDVLGIDPDEYEFVWVGDVEALPHGAHISVGRPRPPEIVAEADAGADVSGLPRGVVLPPRPLEMILRPRPAPPPPFFDVRSIHRWEAGYTWTPSLEPQWSLEYRPWEMWLKGRAYLAGEVGVMQRAGEASVYGSVVGGTYLGRDRPQR